ncbi:MAG TPA: aminopeptidase P family protein [Abditibacteriaceae bacterium]|nr:aminopeptidase P family protein [Abditibacteriaceae bacterium]
MNYSARLDALRRATPRLKCDALVISELTNVRYACGFTGTSGMVVVTPGAAYFITDFRYQAQAAAQVERSYATVIADRGLWKAAAKLLKKEKVARVAFEAEHTSVATLEEITKLLKPATPVATQRTVEKLRLHKDAEEIALTRRAVAVIDHCFDHICGVMKPGMTECEVSDELSSAMRARGASGPSFTTIVASGLRSALPHGVASDKVLQSGDLVTIDMGAIVDGYCSDMTRTVCLGKPQRRQQEIYEIVWRAQSEAAAALRPGLGCKAADALARKAIEEAGYGQYFGHGLGHGVGLNIHEPPRLSKWGKGKLEPGMLVTCEPGIYLEGWGGVRIEDMLLITATGAEVLTRARKPRKILAL